ncbi:DUF6299 family protein [Streptomyces sp. NPDC020965]|uniref:DUF6299 family protein n=1 Tax=Streptomyces sp. NPDC020965 TaxID=3365105 RepID=UPI003791B70E
MTGLTPGTAGAQFAPDSITIDPAGRIGSDGSLTLTGTYRCWSSASGPVIIGSKVLQGAARAEPEGSAARCDGRVRTWRGVDRDGAGFRPGAAQGEVTLLRLDTSGGFVPFPVLLDNHRAELTLRRS